ncbi:hypothetical protein [Undibacterium flavidum]|uniref:Uncharacterized protein n=1 Tax=Undibacterium flavidum TaxID=2762297 RepID=A0ABR6Y9V7_9BURK|nr:hypothetical protein [Undibacterium flavidum]MBC3873415.1 hypothetical protein [Undibacterium flavidum]
MYKLRNRLKRPVFLGIALLQIASLSACSDLPLVRVQETVPQDIAATSQVLKINHRHKINNLFSDGYFEIGEYAITRVKKDSSSSSNSQIGPYSQSSTKSGFQFHIADAQGNWDVFCETRADGNVLKVFGLDTVSNKRKMHCDLRGQLGNASIDIREEMDAPVGEVSINQSHYAVRAYSYGNPHPERFRIPEIYGFRVDDKGKNLSAIELANTPGRAWLDPGLPANQRAAMTGVLAALLIYYGS